ncbi:MAG: hypothetical protein US57_C0002G0046 [Candidatus Moranbacteria bacterium GW2011_GWC2_37_73]|nr:MAG: hypothetical protein UR95_C0002G0144 [Parcubacteria group bacterium GW2011_GWC1_36_108]KKQ01013.1 MAG: hypothetical protein US09_C0003G0013 [Candidatus Moranbacteria bacterium GW2011_GWD1_36_198]KKQ02415.1 MAG: hypothetical protein US10_C0001G0013 [Candidatus Moranbacteria bacterium GW2011_GWD2_36_198]KKQ40339.1 MAG: hypothetical protein US57_C0002G0046 [Candidatus Moranbacteria bacterium GW2011_GWC2_37_73]HAS00153.1 hypothetical protein [Candidatus Moranbacteria bacterium]
MKNLLNRISGKKLCAKDNIFQPFPFQGGFEKKKILEDGTRVVLTKERKLQIITMLCELEKLFDCSGLSWIVDGGLSVSILLGDFIGEHRDLDLAVEEFQLEKLQEWIERKGYGLFVTLGVQSRETMFMKRVNWKEFSTADTYLFWIIAVDENGLIQKDKSLSFINVHIIRRNELGNPLSWGKKVLPAHWFYSEVVEFQGSVLNVASPLKTAYYKLRSMRNYDLTDLRHMLEAGLIPCADIEEIESVLNAEGENKHPEDYYRARKNFIIEMKEWITNQKGS